MENKVHLDWIAAKDGFSLCRQSLADILTAMDISDTGISTDNPKDVWSYYDDWYPYRVEDVWSLVKMREQERDYIPGFADSNYPGVTVSFIAFDSSTLFALPRGAGAETPEMATFVTAFRRVTDLPEQHHDDVLQRYFSRFTAEAPYLIARAYVEKLASLAGQGILPFPDGLIDPPQRILEGLQSLNEKAGRPICDFESRCIRIADRHHLTEEEICVLLASHCGNLTVNSFAAEIQFHAEALTAWESRIPILGKTKWYASAIRADMAVEHDGLLRRLLFDSYHDLTSEEVMIQRMIHGEK